MCHTSIEHICFRSYVTTVNIVDLHVPACVLTSVHAESRMGYPGLTDESRNKAGKRAIEKEGEGKRIVVIKLALFCVDRWLPAIVLQHLEMKHIHLAFRTNGFNKGRAERWGNADD